MRRMTKLAFILILGCGWLSIYAVQLTPAPAGQTRDVGMMIAPLCTLDTINPLCSVISPNGGETLYNNQAKDILWTATDSHFAVNPITIEFSADNGSSYSGLVANQSNSGSYQWTVPPTQVQQAKIRIVAIDSFGNVGTDESNTAFSMAGSGVTISPLVTLDTINPTVDLLSPNGGESWYIGETHDILWTASDSHISTLPVALDYKKLSSSLWTTIQSDLNNSGSYAWLLPSITSLQTQVRLSVKDAFGNTANDVSASPFSIGYVPPASPQNVNVQIVNSRDAIITWSAVNETILGTPIEPTAYLVMYNQTTDPDNDAAYYFLDEILAPGVYTHTHHSVARRAPNMFYRVVAVKDYDGRLNGILAGLNRKANPDHPISWTELKRRLAD